jgi:hypothetical protein
MKLTLRELFLLVALVATGCGWWRQYTIGQTASEQATLYRQMLDEVASMNRVEVEAVDGQFVLKRPNPRIALPVTCPACKGELDVDADLHRSTTDNQNGQQIACWQETGICEKCGRVSAKVLAPRSAPNFNRWALK